MTQATANIQRSTSYTVEASGDLMAPSVGRVHLVGIGGMGEERDHFLTQMDADANMGAKALRQSSRKGPFRNEGGRSRVVSRTAHVVFRLRGKAVEITIRRGVTSEEMDNLFGKLTAHRISVHHTMLFYVERKSRKLGRMDRIDLDKLRAKVYKGLTKMHTVGIRLMDTDRLGATHRGKTHSLGSEDFARSL